MANLQVKSIDDRLYETLGRRAAMENRSISQEVVSILKAYLSTPISAGPTVNQQFLDICGTWEGSESAEDMSNDIRKSRDRVNHHRDLEF